ncbi:c-type cytochrome biogenesis protein CcmI [Microvirga flavescens]|uniref:c-type cytochrome biogenesis protein CcmI n=1 Tax=Microvirga flavescens TaxID=2249811 RepID=UPI000DDBEC3B|nr:c-type cytochrome biogenesis protein CcmI [Microvirga flavescens]
MVIWIIFSGMTAAAVMAVLWPLSRHRVAAAEGDPNIQFYRDQLAEIARDEERGLLVSTEAEAARVEAGRRLLRASAERDSIAYAVGEPALRRRRAVSTLGLSLIPIVALAVYGAYGSPHISRALPPTAPQVATGQVDLAAAVAQIESHLTAKPDDGRGWDVIAPVYMRMGRIEDAVKAYAAATRLLDKDANRFANYGEAMVMAQGGIVSAEAQKAFEQAIALDPSLVKGRFYLARVAEQDGLIEKARAEYAALINGAPVDAPWVPVVKEQLARLEGEVTQPAEVLPNAEAIAGMVAGLAARLESQGGSAQEWARLMRSYVVLGQRDKAVVTLSQARLALARDPEGLRTIDAMAGELKLNTP